VNRLYRSDDFPLIPRVEVSSIQNVQPPGGGKAEADMPGRGNSTAAAAKDKWIKDFSDHSLM